MVILVVVLLLQGMVLGLIPWLRNKFLGAEEPVQMTPQINTVQIGTNEWVEAPGNINPNVSINKAVPTGERWQIDQVNTLNELALQQRWTGDFEGAKINLNRALGVLTNHPPTMANLAAIHEASGDYDSARKVWEDVVALGQKAAPTEFIVASEHLTIIDKLRTVNQPPKEDEWLKINSIDLDKANDPETEERRNLKVELSKRVGAALDPSKVKIMIYFYDKAGEEIVVSTTAKIEKGWVTAPVDWNAEESETLLASYIVAKGGRKKDQSKAGKSIIFYGYIVKVFYNNVLQDHRAFPEALAKRTP
ncbi:MAG: hypothetical protein SGI71_13000 [Verrucomicrobiota bacterium]|nr:hypothetical protein [Verrucomicrobiota bacterium]